MSDIINSQCTYASEDFSRHTHKCIHILALSVHAYETIMLTTTTTTNSHICLLGRRQKVRFILLYFRSFCLYCNSNVNTTTNIRHCWHYNMPSARSKRSYNYVCVHIYVHVYVCIYVCMYIYAYMCEFIFLPHQCRHR